MIDELRFDGLVAFVTGGTSGLGMAYCKLLASRGATVVVNGNARPSGVGPEQEVAADIRGSGGEAIGVNGSICDDAAIERMIGQTIDKYGRLDILINNAGTLDITMDVREGPDPRLYAQLEIHTAAPMRMVRAAWKHLVASGHGRIVNTGSSSAYGAGGDGGWDGAYGTAKATVFALTRQMAGAGEPHGIRANVIIPWGFTRAVQANTAGNDFGKWMAKNTPPERVAAVVAYLAHRDCSSNGQFFTAAGGRVTRVFFASTAGFYKPDLTSEDVKNNLSQLSGGEGQNGYFSNVLDLTGVEREFQEHDRCFQRYERVTANGAD